VLPHGAAERDCRWRLLVDPIDGTRGLMYQKRPAWILTGVAPNRGADTRLRDIELAVQTEIPLVKQHLCDQLWAVRGEGVEATRLDRLTGSTEPLALRPSRADTIAHGFASVSRFFPGARDVLAAIDDEVASMVLGPPVEGKASCFEDQYISTGGQLYELMAGHDRYVADLRPLLQGVLHDRGLPNPLCCHPYDLCTILIAEELGLAITGPDRRAARHAARPGSRRRLDRLRERCVAAHGGTRADRRAAPARASCRPSDRCACARSTSCEPPVTPSCSRR
jgi:hypothetical protein